VTVATVPLIPGPTGPGMPEDAADPAITLTWAELDRELRQAERTGLCARPIRLKGRIAAIDLATGELGVMYDTSTGGDTKTRRSRRTLALPRRCIDALHDLRQRQGRERAAAGSRWQNDGLVFTTRYGTPLSPENVRRDFRKAIKHAPGVDAGEWTPRELRHSFVSPLSDSGIPVEQISRLVGHKSTAVTELIYRKQIRPVLQHGTDAMDRIFRADGDA
jgi:integrase